MINENQKKYTILLVLIDTLLIVLSYTLSWYLVFESKWERTGYSREFYFRALLIFILVLLFFYWMFRVWRIKSYYYNSIVAWPLFKAHVLSLLVLAVVQYLAKDALVHFSRTLVACFYAINYGMAVLLRVVIGKITRRRLNKEENKKHVLLIGYSRAACNYIDRIIDNPELGFKLRGILDDHVPRGTEYKGIKVISTIKSLMMILEQNRLDEIVITLNIEEYERLEEIVAACEKSGVHTKFVPDYNDVIPVESYTEDILGQPVIHIRNIPLSGSFKASFKRYLGIVTTRFKKLPKQ